MFYKYLFLLCSLFLLWSCEQQLEEIIVSARNNEVYINTPSSNNNNSQTTFDWDGSYTEILTCDDCDDVEITLTLNLDYTYKYEVQRLSTEEFIKIEKGSFVWDDEGNEIILNNKRKDRYLIEEERIYQIDNGDKIIDNISNELLVLTKDD